jgi:hypothetical protein
MILSIAVILFCMGCAGSLSKNYGSFIIDQNASKAFESYQINPDFNYYASGGFIYPNALMGLNKAYTLDSDLWRKIEPTQQEFRELIQNMQMKALNIRQHPHGFAILDDKGKQIGIWYSIMGAKTAIQMKDERRVIIFTPALDTYGDVSER